MKFNIFQQLKPDLSALLEIKLTEKLTALRKELTDIKRVTATDGQNKEIRLFLNALKQECFSGKCGKLRSY